MTRPGILATIGLLAFMTTPVQSADLTADPLAQYLWEKRPIVVFADTPNDPRFIRQMELLAQDPEMLEERDIVILTDTNAAEKSALRISLRPRDFQLTIIGKDGKVKLRKPHPWTVRELSRVIDKMPVRRQEMRQSREP